MFVALLVVAYAEEQTDGEKRDERKEKYGTIIGIDLGTTYSWLVNFYFAFLFCAIRTAKGSQVHAVTHPVSVSIAGFTVVYIICKMDFDID
jgi:hypothetical protein